MYWAAANRRTTIADGAPRNLRSLQDRLRNHSRVTQLPFGRVQRLLGVVVVGQMLGDQGLGVVKGGSNLEARLGIAATRASSDLDVVRTRSIERLRDWKAEALQAGWHGFSGRIVDRGPIGAPVPDIYQPHRLEVKLEYRGQPGAGTITLEVAVEEIDALEHVDAVTSEDGRAIFDAVGLPAPGPLPRWHSTSRSPRNCTLAPPRTRADGSTSAPTISWTCSWRIAATTARSRRSERPASGCSPRAGATPGPRR